MTPDKQSHEDVFERAVKALRSAPVPDGPSSQIVSATLKNLSTSSITPDDIRTISRRKFMLRLYRYGGIATAVSITIMIGGWFLLMDRFANRGFAQVLENVKKAQSVSFIISQKFGNQPEIEQKAYIDGDKFRLETTWASTVIADFANKKAIGLNPDKKQALRWDLDKRMVEVFKHTMANPIEALRQLKDEDAEKIKEEEADGRKLDVYRLKRFNFMGIMVDLTKESKNNQPRENVTLWVDHETGMPTKITLIIPDQEEKGRKSPGMWITLSQFKWNPKFDLELFKMEIPEGYKIHEGPPTMENPL
jgi:outer membrane lipoprotein-sorting protein